MLFDLHCALDERFNVDVPPVPIAAIHKRARKASARNVTRLRLLVAAVALTSGFTLTLALERSTTSRATVPIVSSTPAPLVT